MAENREEKVFEYYLDFPAEVRSVVIDQMSPEDRCRFTRCSKSSQKEAKKCKNYIYGFDFYGRSERYMVLRAYYSKEKFQNSYSVHFVSGGYGDNYMKYTNGNGVELWRTELDRSTNMKEYAGEHFKNVSQMYQNTIKILCLCETEDYDFGITSLKNLEILQLYCSTDIRQFISKTRKPLQKLNCDSPITKEMSTELEQLYQVQNELYVNRIHISYAQFLRLSASNIEMNDVELTEENIFDFIKLWQNDKIRNNFQLFRWRIRTSNFDLQKLLRLLGIHKNVNEIRQWTKVEIKHNMDAEKKAQFGFYDRSFEFRVLNQ